MESLAHSLNTLLVRSGVAALVDEHGVEPLLWVSGLLLAIVVAALAFRVMIRLVLALVAAVAVGALGWIFVAWWGPSQGLELSAAGVVGVTLGCAGVAFVSAFVASDA